MDALTQREITALLLALGTLLFCARALGELAKRFNQPSVLGEILAGILLGPTVLGVMAPQLSAFLFPRTGGGAFFLDGLTTLAIVLFLLVAGIEVDLSTVWRQGKVALWVGLTGMALPFTAGFALAWWAPGLVGYEPGVNHLAFSLFIATVLSISALPIIAKILLDLKIYRSDLGMVIISAAVFNDLLGWMVFAVVLSMVGASHGLPLSDTIWMTLVFSATMLTVVPWVIHRIIPWIQAYTSWPGGVLGFALSFGLFSAAFSEWLGIHAIFGSFLAGVALGHSSHLREQTRTVIDQFVSFIFAPLFFAGIGLKVDFAAHFDLSLCLLVLSLAMLNKVVGSTLGGRLGGLPWREAWGAGFGMSAQGTMGIILGVLALQIGLINQKLFVALVCMALFTSMMSGPLLARILRLKKPRKFTRYLDSQTYVHRLATSNRPQVIRELAEKSAKRAGLSPDEVARAVLDRESIMATGIGQGVAVPHARLAELEEPLVCVGLSEAGVDFDAPDGKPAQVIFLILTPKNDDGAQLEILSDIASTFKNPGFTSRVVELGNYTEFIAFVKSGH